MDRRCAAGALVALAACIATTAAAPTASNQTALDLYDGASEGCYYNFQHYGEGDRIMTNEPCLNCTCHNRMLMCYLRVCPFTKPIGQDCSVEKRADQCCPIVTCPDVPVDLLTSTSTSSPSEYGETGLGKLDRYGCSINGKYFPEGSKVPPSPNKPCEHCYCIRNMTTCVMQECTLHVDGCTPIYRKDVCCPVRYSCDHPEDEIPLLDDMTTTVRPTPGFLLTTTTLSPVTQLTQDCVHDDKIFADGALIKTEKACEHCYCMKGDIVCVVQECGTPMENEGKNCTSMPPREGQCCPDTYICEGDEVTTETKPDIATVTSFEDITTLSPPRRVSVEGSGYRSETDEPYTEVPIFESDSEGSGEDQPPFKPTDTSDLLTPESETSTAFIGTVQDDIADKNILITTGLPESDKEMAEKVTTDAESDKETYEKATTEAGPYNQIIEKATTEAGADKEMAEKVTTDSELENEMAEKATTEAGSFNEIIEMATTEAAADKEISEKVTTDARPEKEIAEKATTEAGSYNEIVDKATTEAGADKEMAEKATTEADKGENTVPSGDLDEDTSEASLQDKTSPQIETTTSKLEAATESSGNAKTTVLLEDETSTEDKKTTPHEEITATEPAPIAETTIADEVNTAPGSRITSEGEHAETTLPTRRKEDDRLTSNQITTLAHSEEATTKATDLIAPDTVATESTTASFIEQGTTSKVPEKDVDRQEPTTEENLELTTKFDIIKTETQSATTVQPEIATDLPTPGKVDFTDTTSANPIENEIDEESFPTLAPGRIPGEGDCLLDGITYSHESIVPSTSNCHTSCRCISSIVKCEPIICSPPPDYMDNCQPMYDSPESCCPTYVCDHPKETVPPQSHSQMAGTENPVPTPTIECDGDQCDVAKDKEGAKPPVSCTSEGCTDDSSKKPVETTDCGPQGCGVPTPTIECDGDKCEVVKHKEDAKPPVSCTSEGCTEDASKKQDDSTDCGPQGCGVPTPTIECNGDQCEVVKDKGGKPPVSCTSEGCTDDSSKKQVDTTDCGPQGCGEVQTKPEEPRPSEPAEECTGDNCLSPPLHCAAGNCETPIPKDQTCNNENGCEVPVIQTCESDNCAIQPDHTATKDDSTPCDNPESCKDGHIPDKPSDCEGESCVFVSPSQTIPQKDCKDGDNCVQQTPVTEECNEEDCKRQQVPKVDKPPSDCTGTECIQQQDIEPQITHVPEINTESAPKVTGLPEESDIKLKEPVTDLPKTTTVQTEDTVPSATTIGSISDSKEELETTPHYDVIEKEKEPEAIVPESPETVTPEGQKQESVTEGAIEKETTMGPLQDITTVKQVISEITPAVSESPSTETPSLPDKDTKEITTSVTEDTATDKDALDITTTEPSQPAVHSTSSDINQATTESQEMLTMAPESLDRDGHEETTKEPEYVQDTEPKVTERYTSAPEQVTDKLDVEPIEEQEPHDAPTTPKSYDIQTNVPGILETEAPSTSIPETQTTSPQEEDKKESELPVSTLTSEEPITDKPDKTIDTDVDVSSPDNKAETKSPVDDFEATTKSEIALDGSETQSPELSVTPVEQAITKAPVDETEIQTESYKPLITSPQETATEESDAAKKDTETPAPPAVNVPTQTPMSIVKDYGDDEISSTTTPQSEITSVHDELITKTPESPESGQSTETPSEKPVSEFEKMPSVSDVEHAAATTEKSGADLETTISSVKDSVIPSEQSVHDTDITAIPETEASTDSTPVSVPTIMEAISSGPSVTEPSIQESSAPQEETSEAVPITSVPREDMETKLPVPVTESSVQPISVGVEIITPAQEHTNENTDATELPELVIHEHPTEPSSIIKETDQPATEDTTTNLPDMADKEQEITPEKDTSESSDAPTPQDDVTVAPQITTSESQKEMKVTSDQESVTKMPEFSVSEIDDLSHIPESSPTESQKEVTEGSQANTTNAPETTVTDAQKGATETPAIQTTISSVTKISETEPQETVTEVTEVQNTVTDADVLVTQPHKHTTDAPVSYDMITKAPDVNTEPHKESTDKPEESEMELHKETTGIHDITTTIPETSPTESQKQATEDTATKISDIPPTELDKDDVKPEIVTSVPNISATEPQDEVTAGPQAHDVATSVPETESKTDITASVVQDLTTSIPTTFSPGPTTLPETDVTKPQKEGTETPTHGDTSTYVPDVHATESQKEVTDGPEAQDVVTNVPETPTESHKQTQSPETEAAATSAPELPETEPKKETTEFPAQEAGSTVADISETEPKKEVTKMPEIQVVTDNATTTEVTNVPEAQDAATNAPEVQTESHKEVTEGLQTEPHNVPTETPESQNTVVDLSEVLPTESQKEVTEIPDITMTMASNAPETLATKSDKDVTETPQQVTEEVTKIPGLEQTEVTEINAETEKPAATEKDEALTETPLRITTKFDDHAQSEPHEFVTSTESSKTESDTSLSTESGSPIEQFTQVTELLMTESPDKTTGSDSDLQKPSTGVAVDDKKPEEGQEIDTEAPIREPTKTESPISPELIEPETKAPELMENGTTIAPESYVTENQDHTYAPENEPHGSRRTEATSAPVEEEDIVTKVPQTLEPQDKTTKISEEPEQTSESKEKYPETTPYLVLLEEHTHKTVSPDEDINASPSDVPLKDYETSTSEVIIDRVTESASSSEPDKSPEDVISDKDHSTPELTLTTISEKITESSLVPEEVTTISPLPESISTEKPQYVESNEISTSAPMIDQELIETEKPSVSSVEPDTEKVLTSQKPPETTAPEEEFIYATTKATPIKEESTTLSPLLDKFGKPDDKPKPAVESEKPKPDTTEELPKPGANEVQPTEEAIQPEEESHFPPSGTSGYGQEPDYGEEDSFGPGTCRYGGKVYVSAQQIPRDDPCDFCFCFRSDIICLQQSCPPPIHGCHEEPIQGFCCPRYECPVSMATTLNVTTTTTTTTTTLPPHFLPHAYKGAAQRRGCQIKGHTYKVGEVVRASSGPCLHCTCGGDGQMKCDPKVCTPEPMLRQMIAAAVSAKRRR